MCDSDLHGVYDSKLHDVCDSDLHGVYDSELHDVCDAVCNS